MTSVVIVADSGREMARLTASVQAIRGMEIVRYASGRTSVGRLLGACAPALVLVGEISPRTVTLERLREIRAAAPQAAVVVVAVDPGARWLAEALRGGATAVVAGESSPEALGTVLQEVLAPNPRVAAPVGLAA